MAVVREPAVMPSFFATTDMVFPPERPIASMICISLLVISLNSSVIIASSSSFSISLNKLTRISLIVSYAFTGLSPFFPGGLLNAQHWNTCFQIRPAGKSKAFILLCRVQANSACITSLTVSIFFDLYAFAPQNRSPFSTFPFTASIRLSVMQYGIWDGLHFARHP